MVKEKIWDPTTSQWVQTAPTMEEFATHKADYVKHPGVAKSNNIANAYSVTLDPSPGSYLEGMGIVVTANADSSGATTLNVNDLGAKPVLKANGKPVTNLKNNGVYTVRYNPSAIGTGAFILQGEGGSGNLQPNQALKGYTFSNDEGDQVGLGDANLVSTNIKSGVRIFGVNGSLITFGTVTPGDNTMLVSSPAKRRIEQWQAAEFSALVKSVVLFVTGVVRVKFTMQQYTSALAGGTRLGIFVNGVKFGADYYSGASGSSTLPMTYTVDVPIKAGDYLQLKGHALSIPSYTLYADVYDFTVGVTERPFATIDLE
ncbi:hypothetical protein [Sporosarcina sp. SAFN-010]|uniref:hypothetical protein n=1 Tax=Sporosarcina sp. SAFN-010 TaxID=3387273 RepID=UPI003F7DFEAD